jgi:hypothetical protein
MEGLEQFLAVESRSDFSLPPLVGEGVAHEVRDGRGPRIGQFGR